MYITPKNHTMSLLKKLIDQPATTAHTIDNDRIERQQQYINEKCVPVDQVIIALRNLSKNGSVSYKIYHDDAKKCDRARFSITKGKRVYFASPLATVQYMTGDIFINTKSIEWFLDRLNTEMLPQAPQMPAIPEQQESAQEAFGTSQIDW